MLLGMMSFLQFQTETVKRTKPPKGQSPSKRTIPLLQGKGLTSVGASVMICCVRNSGKSIVSNV